MERTARINSLYKKFISNKKIIAFFIHMTYYKLYGIDFHPIIGGKTNDIKKRFTRSFCKLWF